MEEKAKLINMADYEKSGEGANGESFNHKADKDIMLKLYVPGKIQQPLDEMHMALKVYQAGIPSPEPGEYVTDGNGRYGIRFRRINGKKSYARACGDNPEMVPQYAEEFARMCLDLHAIHVDRNLFESQKERYCRLLAENPFYTTAEKAKIEKFILDSPDTDTAIHGDLQFGNALFSPEGRFFIDLGDFSYGYHLFDVGMIYLTCMVDGEDFIQEAFHMNKATAEEFWRHFAPAYFGADRPLKDIEEEILPYSGLKTLIIERDTKCRMPELRRGLELILG